MMKTNLLCQVANTLYLNHYQIESIGLQDGRMGITWFMYQYARKSGWKQYEELGDYLLEQILNNVHMEMSPNFLTGIAGIGWCIRHLIDNSFIEADDDVLENYDTIIYNRTLNDCIQELDITHNPVYTNGLYALYTQTKEEKEFTQISYLEKILKLTEKRILPIGFLNSILYVYLASTFNEQKNGQSDFGQLFYLHTTKALQANFYTKSDRNILKLLVKKANFQQSMNWNNLLPNEIITPIVANWQILIYAPILKSSELSCNEQTAEQYIKEKLINLTPDDLSLNGLTGWALQQIV